MVYLGAYHKFLEYKKRSDEEIRFFKAYPQDEIRQEFKQKFHLWICLLLSGM